MTSGTLLRNHIFIIGRVRSPPEAILLPQIFLLYRVEGFLYCLLFIAKGTEDRTITAASTSLHTTSPTQLRNLYSEVDPNLAATRISINRGILRLDAKVGDADHLA